jgi:hypothetical protein
VGESRTGVRTVAWAYDTPAAPTRITWAPVATATGEGGIISLLIEGVDAAETGTLEIVSAVGETQRVAVGRNDVTVRVPSFRVGSNAANPVTVTPLSRFALPPGLGGQPNGMTTTITANGVGAPLNVTLSLVSRSTGDGLSTIDAVATAQPNGTGSQLRFGIVPYDERGSCTPVAGGDRASFPGMEDGRDYRYFVCVESWYDGSSFGSASADATVRAQQSGAAPQGYTFRVAPDPVIEGQAARWRIVDDPAPGQAPPRFNVVVYEGWGPGTSVYDRDPGIRVFFRHRIWGTESDRGPVVPAPGSAPYQVQARWSVGSCVAGAPLSLTSSSSNGEAGIAWSDAGAVFYDAAGAALPYTAGTWTVPAGATRVEGLQVTVSWNAAWNLAPASQTLGATCDPGTPPEPAP